MDAVKFIEERSRMCKSFNKCSYGCPAWGGSCKLETGTYLECEATKQVEIVEEWSAAHPRKTRQSVFLEQWPDTQLDKKGNVIICPKQLCRGEEFNKLIAACRGTNCYECRRKFWGKVVQ